MRHVVAHGFLCVLNDRGVSANLMVNLHIFACGSRNRPLYTWDPRKFLVFARIGTWFIWFIRCAGKPGDFHRQDNNKECKVSTPPCLFHPHNPTTGPAVSEKGGFRDRAGRIVERCWCPCFCARGTELVYPGADCVPGGGTELTENPFNRCMILVPVLGECQPRGTRQARQLTTSQQIDRSFALHPFPCLGRVKCNTLETFLAHVGHQVLYKVVFQSLQVLQ